MEIWKDIKTKKFRNRKPLDIYMISSNGRIKNKITDKLLKPKLDKNGYITYNLRCIRNGEIKSLNFYAHILLCDTFKLFRPIGCKIINHKDGNKLNIDLNNLEWCDYSHNNKHAYKNNLNSLDKKIGLNNPNCKYDDETVTKICIMLSKGKTSKEISKQLKINKPYIDYIRKRKGREYITKNYSW